MLDLSLGSRLLAKNPPQPRELPPRPSDLAAVTSRFDRGNRLPEDQGPQSDLERLAATPGAAEAYAAFDAQDDLAALQREAYAVPPELPLDVLQRGAYNAPEDLAQELMADQRQRDEARVRPEYLAGYPSMGPYTPPPAAPEDDGRAEGEFGWRGWGAILDAYKPRNIIDTFRRSDDFYAGRGRALAGRLGAPDLLSAFVGEAVRPTSIAAMAIPPFRAGRIANPALRILANAGVQGGANVAQDVALGRADGDYWTDPKGFALSGGLGAGLGGLLPETGAALRTLRDVSESPRVRAALASESGAMSVGERSIQSEITKIERQMDSPAWQRLPQDTRDRVGARLSELQNELARSRNAPEPGQIDMFTGEVAEAPAPLAPRNVEGQQGQLMDASSAAPQPRPVWDEDAAARMLFKADMKRAAADPDTWGPFVEHYTQPQFASREGRWLHEGTGAVRPDAARTAPLPDTELAPDVAPAQRVADDAPRIGEERTPFGDDAAQLTIETSPLRDLVNPKNYRFGLPRRRPRTGSVFSRPDDSWVSTTVDQVYVGDARDLQVRALVNAQKASRGGATRYSGDGFLEVSGGKVWRDVQDWEQFLTEGRHGEQMIDELNVGGRDDGPQRVTREFTRLIDAHNELNPRPPYRPATEAGGGRGAPPKAPKRPATTGGGGEPPPPRGPGVPAWRRRVPSSEGAAQTREVPTMEDVNPAKPPTIPEIEARSVPLSTAERAALTKDAPDALFVPDTFDGATERYIRRTPDLPMKMQYLMQKVPFLRAAGTYLDTTAAALSQKARGNAVPLSQVKRDLYAMYESVRAHAQIYGWAGREAKTLGVDAKFYARAVTVKPGAKIPKGLQGHLGHIVEHPEKYVITPEQRAALKPVADMWTAIKQRELEYGVDINEVANYYPRVSGKSATSGGAATGYRAPGTPGHAKDRAFKDIEDAWAAGFGHTSPREAMFARVDSGIRAIANRGQFSEIKELGEKPLTRLTESDAAQFVKRRLEQARTDYKATRAAHAESPSQGTLAAMRAAEKRLELARGNFRTAASKAIAPREGETKAFGRIFDRTVMEEMEKYADVEPGWLDEFFSIQRANETTGDHSGLGVQGGTLAWRNSVAFLKAAGYSTAAFVREPMGWAARNADAWEAAAVDGAVGAPSEFSLASGGAFSRRLGQGAIGPDVLRPVTRVVTAPIRAAQRGFDWFGVIGAVEYHKGAVRLGATQAERIEQGAAIRKIMGSSSRPGMTRAMRKFDARTLYAGSYFRATTGFAADIVRAGPRGDEARKTFGMLVGGATAMTIAMQYAYDRTFPNLTDPNNRTKRWGYVEFEGGGINLYGPLYPLVSAQAKAAQSLATGEPRDALEAETFFATSKAALPIRTGVELGVTREDFNRNPIEPGWPGALKYFGKQAAPIGSREVVEMGVEGQREFPQGNIALLGGRSSRSTVFRDARRDIEDAGGDFKAALETHPDNEGPIRYYWRKDFEKRAAPLGLTVVKGAFAEVPGGDPLSREARIEIDSVDAIWGDKYARTFALETGEAAAKTYSDQRKAYVDARKLKYMKAAKVTEPVAYDELSDMFDALPIAKAYRKATANERLNFWDAHPAFLVEAFELGLEDDNPEERKIMDAYRGRQQIAAGR